MGMYKRHLSEKILSAVSDTPVVLINGGRQTGKSTLVKDLLSTSHAYWTFDDSSTISAVKNDPIGFVSNLKFPVILDEIQRVPEIFLPIKTIVDKERHPGQFVLTGSANVLMLPNLADSLAGRMEIHTLYPLSQGEILGIKEDFISQLFGLGNLDALETLSFDSLVDRILKGGYPEIQKRLSFDRQKEWFRSYVMTILQKDIRDLSDLEGLMELPNLLSLLASRAGNLLNMSELSRSLGIPNTTLKRYLTLLERVYFVHTLPAWSRNYTKRLVKAPKVYLNDTGLLTYLMGINKEGLLENSRLLGHVLENFVVMELLKQITWSKVMVNAYHYRTFAGKEVDIVLESMDLKVVGIEVKLSKTVSVSDFKGIDELEKEVGEKFCQGIVLYAGDRVIPFAHNKKAVPLSCLWG